MLYESFVHRNDQAASLEYLMENVDREVVGNRDPESNAKTFHPTVGGDLRKEAAFPASVTYAHILSPVSRPISACRVQS